MLSNVLARLPQNHPGKPSLLAAAVVLAFSGHWRNESSDALNKGRTDTNRQAEIPGGFFLARAAPATKDRPWMELEQCDT